MDNLRFLTKDFHKTLKRKEIKRIENRLQTIEKELEKVRNYSVQLDGWQTHKLAKKSRGWDILAVEKFELRQKLIDLNMSFNICVGMNVKDYNGFECFVVECLEDIVYCNFKGNEGDVLEYKYYELERI